MAPKILDSLLQRGVVEGLAPSDRLRVRLSNEIALMDGLTAVILGPTLVLATGQWR